MNEIDKPRSDPSKRPSQAATPSDGQSRQGAVEQRKADNEDAEIGGPKGLEPTRFGDWERKGRCIDF